MILLDHKRQSLGKNYLNGRDTLILSTDIGKGAVALRSSPISIFMAGNEKAGL